MSKVRIRIVTDIPPGGEWWQGIGTTVVVPVQEIASAEHAQRMALYMTPDDVRALVARLNEALELP